MSNCITINNLEHLPNEQTLLIHYMIDCTGYWYLSQLLTAYRGVCDTEWTVMYPNHQHPRHTDFPISVTSPGYPAIFAWNYGGIPGIAPENFDTQHSYLTQITIFEYNCFNTGQTGDPTQTGGSTGSNPTNTGTNTGVSNPGGGGGLPNPKFPRIPPFPGGNGIGLNQDSGNSLGGLGNYQVAPVVPGRMDLSSGESGNPMVQYNQPQAPVYNEIIVGQVGQITTSVSVGNTITVGDLTAYNNQITLSGIRPSNQVLGSSENNNLVFTPVNTSPSLQINNNQASFPTLSRINYNLAEQSSPGSFPGGSQETSFGRRTYSSAPVNQIITSHIMVNATVDIQVINTNITIGQPIVISAFFRPPQGEVLQASMELVAQDNITSVIVNNTSPRETSYNSPITCGTAVSSSNFQLGPVVLSVRVKNSQNQIIGFKSIVVNNNSVPVSSSSTRSNRITFNNNLLPTPILGLSSSPLSKTPIEFDLLEDTSKFLILTKVGTATDLSLVLVTKYTTEDAYQIKVHNVEEVTYTNSSITSTPIVSVHDRIKINGQYWYPETHTVGFINYAVGAVPSIIVEISPYINNLEGDTKGYLYVSENYELAAVTTVATPTQVTATVPFGLENYGLIVNGNSPNVIPESYLITGQQSTSEGFVSFSTTLSNGNYYSIVRQDSNGILNPFKNIVYSGRYES